MIATGLDRLLANTGALTGRRYGLLSHVAARSIDLDPIHLALVKAGASAPARLFGPEHGFYGVEQDMIGSTDEIDPWTGLPTISLYGEAATSLRPDPAVLTDLDLLVIDVQDVGSRYYTYAATAIWSAGVALDLGLEVWVLDRPNPLGGVRIEGNLVQSGFESFVGAFRVPVRHGLTLGELTRLQARREGWSGALRVWEVEGWSRSQLWADCGRPWFAPSPNLPTVEIACLYPGLCLVEGTGLSEGRGTTRPFQLVGAPGLPADALAAALEARRLEGLRCLPVLFRPQFHKHAGQVCGGVELRVTDPRKLEPVRCGVELLAAVREVAPECLEWRREPYEFVDDRPAIDLLAGDDRLRLLLDEGAGVEEWIDTWAGDQREFATERRQILLYPEGP